MLQKVIDVHGGINSRGFEGSESKERLNFENPADG